MHKKLINKLVLGSYKNCDLNPQTVDLIADKLKRKELKEYLNALKREEKKRSVTIIAAKEPTEEEKEMIKKTFQDKKIEFIIDSSLIVGIKIVENDIVYDLNLRNTFNEIKNHVVSGA